MTLIGISLVGPAPTTSAASLGTPKEYVITFDPNADVDAVSAQVVAAAKAPITSQFGDKLKAATITTSVVPEALDNVPGVMSVDLNAQVSAPPSEGTNPSNGIDQPTSTTTTAPGATTTTVAGAHPTSTTSTTSTTTTTTTTIDEPDGPTVPWGLDRSDQRKLPLSNSYKPAFTGAGIKAYVVDSGISANVEFGNRLTAGADFVNDGNGTLDCDGHGTHVAGTIGGADVGMAPGVTLVPVRVLDCDGHGDVQTVVQGLNWILTDHPSGPGVVNMSLGGSRVSTAIDLGVQALIKSGLTVVTAAGNDGVSACNRSVGTKIAGSIVVGATDWKDQRADFSDFGPCVDLFAPGEDIVSAGFWSPTALDVKSGTSMAAPHVAGAAAVLLALDGWRTPADVEKVLVDDATAGIIGGVGDGSPNLLLYSDPDRAASPAPPSPPVVQDPASPVTSIPAVVLGTNETPSAPVAASDVPLAFTGGNPRVLVIIALCEMVAGAVLLVASRRRRELRVGVPVAAAPAPSPLAFELVRRPRH